MTGVTSNRKTEYKLIIEGSSITNTTISFIENVPGRITPGAEVTNPEHIIKVSSLKLRVKLGTFLESRLLAPKWLL